MLCLLSIPVARFSKPRQGQAQEFGCHYVLYKEQLPQTLREDGLCGMIKRATFHKAEAGQTTPTKGTVSQRPRCDKEENGVQLPSMIIIGATQEDCSLT